MAAPTFVDATQAFTTDASVDLAAPAGLQSGDHQLIVVVSGTSGSPETIPNFTIRGQFSGTIPNDTSSQNVAVYTSSTGSTGTITIDNPTSGRLMTVARLAWRGGNGWLTSPAPAGATRQESSSHALPTQSTTAADQLVVGAVLFDTGDGDDLPATLSMPSPWVERAEVNGAGGFESQTIGVFEVVRAGPGTQSGTVTSSRAEAAYVWSATLDAASTPIVDKFGADSATGTESGGVRAELSGGDSAVGTESGHVGPSGGDSAVGSESGYVAEGRDGGDAASGSESGGTGATVTSGDSATGTESGSTSATFDGLAPDTATGTEYGHIMIPGGDSAVGTDFHDPPTQVTVTYGDSAVGSDGGYVETLYGDLIVNIYAIDPDTGEHVALPDYESLDISRERNGKGSVRLQYPINGKGFELLREQVSDRRDLEFELWTNGTPTGALRGWLQEASGDDVVADDRAEDGSWQFAGGFAELDMDGAIVFPQPIVETPPSAVDAAELIRDRLQDGDPILDDWTWDGAPAVVGEYNDLLLQAWEADDSPEPIEWLGDYIAENSSNGNEKRELIFGAATPGEVAQVLLDQAHGRGTLDDITADFTADADSSGVPWPSVLSAKFSPGASYTQVLDKLVELDLAEWAVEWTGTAKVLRLWVPEGRGVDLTVGPRPVVLRSGRNLLDAPHRWSVREAGTTLLAAGAEGIYTDVTDASAVARRGRRIEQFVSLNNLEDPEAVLAFAQARLPMITAGLLSITHGIGMLPGEPRPVIAFDIGDWVLSQSQAQPERLRVVQWTLTIDINRQLSGTVTLNDTVRDMLERLQRRWNALTAGETVVGTSESTSVEDLVPPGPPTGLVATSLAYHEDVTGDTYAAVTLGWLAPVLNTDGTAVTDISGYRIRYKPAGVPIVDPNGDPLGEDDSWSVLGATPSGSPYTFSGVPSGIDIYIQVAAFDRSGNQGPYSDSLIHTTAIDDVPPPAPSAPVVEDWFGTLRITWDGRDQDGAQMLEAAIDFWRIDVHVSQADQFTPDETTFTASIYGATTWNVTNLPIGVEQFVRFVAYDRIGNASAPSAVGSAVPRGISYPDMGPDAIGSAQIRDLAVLTAHIGDAQIVDLKVNTVSVGKLTAGTLNADVLLSGNIRTANSGTRTEMDGAGIRLYSGSTLTVDLSTVTGNALITGEYRTSFNGARLVFNAGGSHKDEIWFYPSSGNQYAVLATHNHMGQVMQAAINMRGNSTRSDGYTGHVGAWPPEAYIKWGGLQAESVSAISCGRLASTWWAPSLHLEVDHRNSNDGFERRIEFRHRDDDGDIRNSSRLYYLESRGDVEEPMLYGPNMGVGLTWAYGSLYVGDINGIPKEIGALNTDPSSRTIKRDERPITFAGGLRALDVVTSIESKAWNYIGDEPDEKPRFGPMAEDVLALVPELVRPRPSFPGGMVIGTSDKIGVLWQALAELAAEVKRLKDR